MRPAHRPFRPAKPTVIQAACSVLALLALAALAFTAADKLVDSRQARLIERLNANCAATPEALVQRLRLAQAQFIEIVPPDPNRPLTQSCGLMAFEPKSFPEDFLKGLVYDYKAGIPFYALTIEEDPTTRDIRILNADDVVICTVAAPIAYDTRWLVRLYRPETYDAKYTAAYRARVESQYDPARVRIRLQLLPADYIAAYAEMAIPTLQAAIETLGLQQDDTQFLMRSPLAPSNIVVDAISSVSTGIELQISYPDDFTNRLDIYSSSNLLHTIWYLLQTNLLTAGTNTLTWVDVSATNMAGSNRFYAAGNANTDFDLDGLADAREYFLYNTAATNRDSDSDGLVDGYSGIVATNTYPSGAHTNGGAYVEGELTWHTLPTVTDTDDDGMGDGWEVSNGHDPTNWNDPPNVRGTVSYAGRQTGTVWVLAVTTSNSWATNFSYSASSSAYPFPQTAYRISHLEQTNYWLNAWLDSNASGTTNATEARGAHTNSALVITNRVTARDITLTDPDTDSDNVPDWWEIRYFGSTTNWPGSGDPDGDQYTNLEEYNADTVPTNSASHPWNISGTVTYSGPQTGAIHVIACTASNSWVPAQYTTIAAPGSYTITHLPPDASYWVKAWRDSNGDSSNTFWEAWGTYADSSVSLVTNVTGVSITLADPDTDGDTLPDWWEVLCGLDPSHGAGTAAAAWWKLDENSGTNVLDSTLNANNGTLYNASNAWTSGVMSNGLLLDGTNDYVEVPDSVTLQPSVGVSVGLWIKPSRTYTNGTTFFLSKHVPGGSTGYSLGYESGALAFTICATGAKTLRYTCALTSAIPLHMVGTFSSSGHRLYINGALSAETNYDWGTGFATLDQGTDVLRLGSASGSTPTNFFSGLLDDVRVCDSALSSNEVHAIYELGADVDGDGLSNFDEYHNGTCPTNSDSDADGLPDGWEIQHGTGATISDATEDADGDGYLNIYEYVYGSDPMSTNSYPAATHTLTNGAGTIQGTINGIAQDYAIVQLLPGVYSGPSNINLRFFGKRLMITGEGTNTVIKGTNGTCRGVAFVDGETPATVLRRVAIQDMNVSAGPLVVCGGGILCSNSSPTLIDCTITRCYGYGGGGLGVIAGANPVAIACHFNGNTGFDGGGVYIEGAGGTFSGCEMIGNGSTNPLYMSRFGAAVWVDGGTPVFNDCVAASNVTFYGAAVDWTGSGAWLNGTIESNLCLFSGSGGGHLSGDITISNALVAYNWVSGDYLGYELGQGGGLWLANGSRAIDCDIIHNQVNLGVGAGLYVTAASNSVTTVERCLVFANSVTNRGNGGGMALEGGLSSTAAAVIRNCQFVGNTSPQMGGGVYAGVFAHAVMENCYLAQNSAWPAQGGGIASACSRGDFVLQNCTIVGNRAGAAGGILVAADAAGSGTNSVRNTIVWDNGANPVSVSSGRLDVATSCVQGGFTGGSNVITADPLLFDGYRLLGTNSLCLDAGDAAVAPTDDIQSEARPWGNKADIGCDEFVMVDSDADGLFDDWEQFHFNGLAALPGDDPDGDQLTNVQEYRAGSNPLIPFEGDLDGDGLADDSERILGTDPAQPDTDGDGMPDGWEVQSSLNPLENDALGDLDSDGLANMTEWFWGASPTNTDSDADGLSDVAELTGAVMGYLSDPANPDTDGDGIPDSQDLFTNSPQGDQNGDGVPDASDANDDSDGLLDGNEIASRIINADSDADGVPDGTDSDPDNPAVWADPPDTLAPSIVTVEPLEGASL